MLEHLKRIILESCLHMAIGAVRVICRLYHMTYCQWDDTRGRGGLHSCCSRATMLLRAQLTPRREAFTSSPQHPCCIEVAFHTQYTLSKLLKDKRCCILIEGVFDAEGDIDVNRWAGPVNSKLSLWNYRLCRRMGGASSCSYCRPSDR